MRKILLNILIVGMLAFIWGNSLVPGKNSGEMSDSVLDTLNALAASVGLPDDLFTYYMDTDGDGVLEPTGHIVRKLAHMTEFGVLAGLVWLRLESRGRKRTLTAFALSALTAGTDELIQRFSIDRGSSLVDVMIDCSGAAVGLLIVAGMAFLLRHSRAKKQSDP